jgi:hypothetical protein
MGGACCAEFAVFFGSIMAFFATVIIWLDGRITVKLNEEVMKK